MAARLALLLVVATLLAGPTAAADAPQAEAEAPWTVRTTVKATGLISRQPDASGQRPSGESLFRLRVEPEVRVGRTVTLTFAYEQRLRQASPSVAGLAALDVLPSEAPTPFRMTPLVWRLGATSRTSWRHEVDRANAHVRTRRADFTLGRQAIGWGRGVMFTAVDLFAPFSPLEIDREWRAGVDAVRADLAITDRSSIDLVGAFGDTLDRSILAVRLRGYRGPLDVEVVAGRRGEDVFGGVTSSAAIADAEVHGEAAAFRVPATGDHDVVWKAVLGASYRLPVGTGLLAYVEYHYSGFGAERPEDIPTRLATPAFAERFVRGDMQILSRHVVGLTARYESSPAVSYAGQWLHNPVDRSGIVGPSMTYTFCDAVSVLGGVYLPYGRAPRGRELRSEYGAASASALLQLRWYF